MNFLGRFSQDSCLKVFWVYMPDQNHWPIVIHIHIHIHIHIDIHAFLHGDKLFSVAVVTTCNPSSNTEFLCLHIFIYTKCCQNLIYLVITAIKFLHSLTFMNLLDILSYEKPVHVQLFCHFSTLFSTLFSLIQ